MFNAGELRISLCTKYNSRTVYIIKAAPIIFAYFSFKCNDGIIINKYGII